MRVGRRGAADPHIGDFDGARWPRSFRTGSGVLNDAIRAAAAAMVEGREVAAPLPISATETPSSPSAVACGASTRSARMVTDVARRPLSALRCSGCANRGQRRERTFQHNPTNTASGRGLITPRLPRLHVSDAATDRHQTDLILGSNMVRQGRKAAGCHLSQMCCRNTTRPEIMLTAGLFPRLRRWLARQAMRDALPHASFVASPVFPIKLQDPTRAQCSATTSASTRSSARCRTVPRCRSTTRVGSPSWRSTRPRGGWLAVLV